MTLYHESRNILRLHIQVSEGTEKYIDTDIVYISGISKAYIWLEHGFVLFPLIFTFLVFLFDFTIFLFLSINYSFIHLFLDISAA